MIVADSSSIISLAINCLSQVLNSLGIRVAVTKEVYDEIITYPINTKRFALESMRIKRLFSEGVVSVKDADTGITKEILDAANSIFRINNHYLRIIHKGEAEAVSLLRKIGAEALLIDERTMRLLIENPGQLREVLSYQNGQDIGINHSNLNIFRSMVPDISVIRSSEIAAIAYEKGILGEYIGSSGNDALKATLYALKFSGCAISWQEIDEYLKIIK